MEVLHLDSESFDSLITSSDLPVIVEFGAERIAFNISTMRAYRVQGKVVVEWDEILKLVKA